MNPKPTAGPWRWEINRKSRIVQLCGGENPFDLTVIDHVRYGPQGAAPRFREDVRNTNIMHHAKEYAAPVMGREHHAEWFAGLNHPDAKLIAEAPAMALCLELIRIGEAQIEGGFEFCFRGIRYPIHAEYPWTAVLDSIGWDKARKAVEDHHAR